MTIRKLSYIVMQVVGDYISNDSRVKETIIRGQNNIFGA